MKESTNVSGGIYVSGFAKQDFSSMGEHVGSAYQGGFGFGTLCVWGGDLLALFRLWKNCGHQASEETLMSLHMIVGYEDFCDGCIRYCM